MLSAVAMGVRVSFGVLLALFLGVVGLYFGWFITPPGPTLPSALLVSFAGVGAGVGGFVSYFKPEVHANVHWTNLIFALIGGMVGAWVGWSLGHVIYPEGVYNPAAPIRTPPFIAAVVGASAGANILSWCLYTYRLVRFREI